ncbi:MAG TPA: hypothetical protein VNO84_12545 [Burkholderiaceae bacterium]|nr:hypothetical protein [Burkholderiaceae bacterium]
MRRRLAILAVAVFAIALVWGAVMWHWHRVQHDVRTEDVWLYLVGLPLAMLLVGALLWRSWRRSAVQAGSTSSPTVEAPPAPASGAQTPAAQAACRLLAWGLAAPGADDGATLLALVQAPPAVTLDPELLASDGFGVFTRRCALAEDGEGQALVDPTLARLPRPCRAWRLALHALQEPLMAVRLRHDLLPVVAPSSHTAPDSDHPTLVMPRAHAPIARPAVRVVWALPAHWAEGERLAAEEAVAAQVALWRAEMPRIDWHLELLPVTGGERALWHAEQRLALMRRESASDLLLLVAADSGIDAAWIDALDEQGQLFTARRPRGQMPGEAAVALLLDGRGDADPPSEADAEPPVLLQPLSLQRRSASADEAGGPDSRALESAFDEAVRGAGYMASDVQRVVADHDLSAGRSRELFQGLMRCLPHEDAAERCLCIGTACGHTGIASALLCVAIAAEAVRLQQAPVCALPVADAHDRLAALVAPVRRLCADTAAAPNTSSS